MATDITINYFSLYSEEARITGISARGKEYLERWNRSDCFNAQHNSAETIEFNATKKGLIVRAFNRTAHIVY
jgi:hypothetical protein